MNKIFKYLYPFFNTRAAGIYILLFATSIGVATFIENDYGTSAAQKVVFKTLWFELLLVLFGISIIVNVFKYRMIQQKKWTLLMFHSAIIVILIGAAVTRYYGFEGMMHIRENDDSNYFLSSETYLKFKVQNGESLYQFEEPVLFASLGNNNWKESYLLGEDLLEVGVKQFIPNPKQVIEESEEGVPIVKVVVAGVSGREEYIIEEGQRKRIQGLIYNFKKPEIPNAINIVYRNDSLLLSSTKTLSRMVMATQQVDTLYDHDGYQSLLLRSLYSDGQNNFVFGDFRPKGRVNIISENRKVRGESMTALVMEAKLNGEAKSALVFGQKGLPGKSSLVNFENAQISMTYGAKERYLPFAVGLYDFIMEKYPGTNSASSYASEVQLIDPRNNLKEDHRIYMNNILDYDGYRFFQSSFDQDEKGTYLSVNHDFVGTWISYIGYILLTIGMVLTFFSKKTRFYQITQKIKNMRKNSISILLFMVFSCFAIPIFSQNSGTGELPENIIDQSHADKFSHVVVQDHKGRMKPIHTLSRELLRKVARTESIGGLSADQVVLGMFVNSREWENVPMIKLGKHSDIRKTITVATNKASYSDFFTNKGDYVFRNEVRRAYELQPIDRGVFEKELMKIDERVNIASMIYSGRFFKIIPIPNDPDNTWSSNQTDHGRSDEENMVAKKFFGAYVPALREAMISKDYSFPNKLLDELTAYQKTMGKAVMPAESVISGEILLNQSNVFNRLAFIYMLLGLLFLFFLFLSIFKPEINLSLPYKILFGLVVAGFLFHTFGLAMRWYVSGRAPWSNGYESMIYIAWTSTLAGLIFTRKSLGGLAATMVLAATVLLVASLSYLDPEITPLVPVLRSYWLTIHVSLEAGSYGFLMLGAVIGLINLILMIFLTQSNQDRIQRIIKEMTLISEITLIGGLFMVSVGTYLGGVWANESWGRYWGWDAKETWALVTILVYAFILHMRLIPKMQGLYAFNLASIFGWASVIMTYYGVNYYLSGLHSYAAGDPIPIPNWVYIVIVVVMIISVLAYVRKRRFAVIT